MSATFDSWAMTLFSRSRSRSYGPNDWFTLSCASSVSDACKRGLFWVKTWRFFHISESSIYVESWNLTFDSTHSFWQLTHFQLRWCRWTIMLPRSHSMVVANSRYQRHENPCEGGATYMPTGTRTMHISDYSRRSPRTRSVKCSRLSLLTRAWLGYIP